MKEQFDYFILSYASDDFLLYDTAKFYNVLDYDVAQICKYGFKIPFSIMNKTGQHSSFTFGCLICCLLPAIWKVQRFKSCLRQEGHLA